MLQVLRDCHLWDRPLLSDSPAHVLFVSASSKMGVPSALFLISIFWDRGRYRQRNIFSPVQDYSLYKWLRRNDEKHHSTWLYSKKQLSYRYYLWRSPPIGPKPHFREQFCSPVLFSDTKMGKKIVVRCQWGVFVHLFQHNFHLKTPTRNPLQFHLRPAQLQGSGFWANLPWPSQVNMHMLHFGARVNPVDFQRIVSKAGHKNQNAVCPRPQKFVSEPELIPNLPNPKYCRNCWKALAMLQERAMLFDCDQVWVCPKIPVCDSIGGRRTKKVLLTLNWSLSLKMTWTT